MNHNEEKLKELFNKYSRRIVLFCNSMIKNMEEAEDISIDVFVELWKRMDNFKTEANAKAFLFITAKHKCINILSRKNQIITCELNEDYAEINAIVMDNLYDLLFSEVENLPARQKEIIKSFLSGLKYTEISNKLGISGKTVLNLKLIAEKIIKEKITRNSVVFKGESLPDYSRGGFFIYNSE